MTSQVLRTNMIIVIMGVSGSGKTTVSQALAERVGWQIAEADDYHPSANKSKMSEGIALTDEDRLPWLIALHKVCKRWYEEKIHGIITCSALKKYYRTILLYGDKEEKEENQTHPDIVFIHLHAPVKIIQSRLNSRSGHFMPSSLLQSQFNTLETLTEGEHGFIVSVELSVNEIVNNILENLKQFQK